MTGDLALGVRFADSDSLDASVMLKDANRSLSKIPLCLRGGVGNSTKAGNTNAHDGRPYDSCGIKSSQVPPQFIHTSWWRGQRKGGESSRGHPQANEQGINRFPGPRRIQKTNGTMDAQS